MNIAIATNVPLNTSFSTPQGVVFGRNGFSIQAVITGTPTGTIALFGSNDPTYGSLSSMFPPTNWTQLPNSAFALTENGTVLWNYTISNFNWVQIGYTDGSGGLSTATLNARINTVE